MRVITLMLLAALASLLFEPVSGQTKSPRKLIPSLDGKELYLAYCASCHGAGGAGDGPVAKALRGPVPDLRAIAVRNGGAFPRERIEKVILSGAAGAHGSPEMPVWGPVFRRVENDQDLGLVRTRRLTAFLESLQRK